jgi:LmbE family N-acetylglucosaminyl deacetylase
MESISINPCKFRAQEIMIMRTVVTICTLFLSLVGIANENPGKIYVNLEKLHSLKRVLYVAAHPDDENTRALAWFSLGEKAETAYFSLTRGDGGQNLIGNELSEELGVLRTQELLEARGHDGARQFFSRAVDFGYSKSAEESFEKWGRDGLLEDLVLMIRRFQPDVIVTRFPPDKRGGHGHHTASAILAIEAFEKAADPAFLPEQVRQHGAWKTTSIYWNTSYWWDKDIRELAIDNPDYLIKDIGGYNPLLGMSYNEIGTIARSQHKCQGFGAIVERGSREEYFQHLGGDKLKQSFFEQNDRTWEMLGDSKLDQMFSELLENFDFIHTENNVGQLLKIYAALKQLPPSYLVHEKIQRCQRIIADCLGLRAELLADDFAFPMGTSIPLKLEVLNRSSKEIYVRAFMPYMLKGELIEQKLVQNQPMAYEYTYHGNHSLGSPFWLERSFQDVFDVSHIGEDRLNAEGAVSVRGTVEMTIDGIPFELPVAGTYKWRDASYGERRRPIIGTPNFSATFEQNIALLKPGEEQEVRVKVHSFKNNLSDQIQWDLGNGWAIEGGEIPIEIDEKHGERWFTFRLKAISKDASPTTVKLKDSQGNTLYNYTEISYDHITTQTIFRPSELQCSVIDAKIKPGRIAYINGVDDGVAEAIELLGFDVTSYEVSDLQNIDLNRFQSVVLGIRIYNVHPELRNFEQQLYEYVSDGGNLIMQYNTASRSGNNTFGPKPFEVSRNRVTEEDAVVTFLEPKHPVLNTPNTITVADFENWVQERGLYFAGSWDDAYTPILSWSDTGEEPVQGGLIVANYGKGQFIYTGISFFRELPNGVVGAYRLFANLLSYAP